MVDAKKCPNCGSENYHTARVKDILFSFCAKDEEGEWINQYITVYANMCMDCEYRSLYE